MDDMDDARSRDPQRHPGDTASWRIVEHVPLPGESANTRAPGMEPTPGVPTEARDAPPAGAAAPAAPDAPVYWEFDRPRLEPNPPATSWATTIPASSNREAAAATEAEFAAGPSWHAYAPSRAAPLDDAVARPSIASHPYEVPARGPVPGRLTGGPITGWAGLPRNAAGVQDSRPAAHAIAQALDRFLLAAVVLVVALCAVGIMAAEASPQANHVILSVAHVDIRASLSHLMAWLRGLRS